MRQTSHYPFIDIALVTTNTEAIPNTMAPIKPHWAQPSHPDVQEVIVNEAAFTTKSISKVTLPPFGLFAKLEFPPCTIAPEATYATVQMSRDGHFDLNSDLLYINHSCEPSLVSNPPPSFAPGGGCRGDTAHGLAHC